jgi:hypothetical protein
MTNRHDDEQFAALEEQRLPAVRLAVKPQFAGHPRPIRCADELNEQLARLPLHMRRRFVVRGVERFVAHLPCCLASKPKRPCPADRVLKEFECHLIADGQIVERRPFLHIAAMKVHLAITAQSDESVTLSTGDLDDAPVRLTATKLGAS